MSYLRYLDVKVASKIVPTNPRRAAEEVKTIELYWSDLLRLKHSMLFAKTIGLALLPMFHGISRPSLPW
jgi:hypothetical protein